MLCERSRRIVSSCWSRETGRAAHYTTLLEYVELWDRDVADSIRWEVLEKLGHSERSLTGFYEDLDHHLELLRAKLAKGEA